MQASNEAFLGRWLQEATSPLCSISLYRKRLSIMPGLDIELATSIFVAIISAFAVRRFALFVFQAVSGSKSIWDHLAFISADILNLTVQLQSAIKELESIRDNTR